MASTVPAGASPRADLDAVEPDRVVRRRQVEVVAGAHQRDDQAELHGDLAAQRLDPVEQVAAAARCRPGRPGRRRARARAGRPASRSAIASGESGDGLRRRAAAAASAASSPSGAARAAAGRCRSTRRRRAGTAAWAGRGSGTARWRRRRRSAPRCAARPSWASRSVPMSPSVADAGDDQAGRDREQQRRDLGDQAVADGQQAVRVQTASPRRHAAAASTPIAKPPIRLISVMMMAAIASPLTNFEAPSIAP